MRFDPVMDTMFVGRRLDWLDETASTNDLMASRLSFLAEGAVLGADFQSAGRGQLGTVWQADSGQNITCSFLFRPTWLAATSQFELSQAVALALVDTLVSLLPDVCDVRIKWPNDIYIGAEKVCGILIQNTLSGAYLSSCIVGVGLNVNQTEFPEDVARATSLARILGQPCSRNAVMQELCLRLEQRYLQLRSRPDQIRLAYLKRLYKIGEVAAFRNNLTGQIFSGIIRGVTAEGLLQVDSGAENVLLFGLKDVSLLPK